MKKLLIFFVSLSFVFPMCGCGKKDTPDKWTIGISMPNKALERWNKDGEYLKKKLTDSGYSTILQYPAGDANTQINQIEDMEAKGAKVIVIAAVDTKSLANVLNKAKTQNITVIAYDRLITDTEDVDFFVTFNNKEVGVMQAKFVEKKLGLREKKGPFNIEFIAGDQADENAHSFYNGAMSVLKEYIDSGKLIVPSGQIAFEKVVTPGWETAKAQSRMDNIIVANYLGQKKLDAVLATSDCLSLGVINALKTADIIKNLETNSENILLNPIITGQDCDKANVASIVKGEQSMSVFKDTRKLGDKVKDIIDSLYEGKEIEINGEEKFNNGAKDVTTYFFEPVCIEKDNLVKELIESGYYKKEECNW
ncbi:MAG: sugar-binding protein [Clostridiales bacterium]|jgi:putative multiple sugar transport system substrate-binding protein|nr:sugar-binding protein [Clostridiales bacterium]